MPKTWPLLGYAPGNYQCKCIICETVFIGDKRAINCLECAATRANASLSAQPQEPQRIDAELVISLANAVCWYDWSENDADAVAAVDRLRAALRTLAPAQPVAVPDGWKLDRKVWRKYPFVIEEGYDGNFSVRIHHKVAGVTSTMEKFATAESAFTYANNITLPQYAASPTPPEGEGNV